MYVCRFAHGGDTFPLETTSLLEGSFGLQEAYTKACPNLAKKITTACWCQCHDTMPSFMIFRCVLDLQELKIKFLNFSGRATMPRCLNFIPISCMGPRNSPKDTHEIFQTSLVHWSMCLQFKFELCTLNAQKLN